MHLVVYTHRHACGAHSFSNSGLGDSTTSHCTCSQIAVRRQRFEAFSRVRPTSFKSSLSHSTASLSLCLVGVVKTRRDLLGKRTILPALPDLVAGRTHCMQNTCQLAVCDDDTGPWAIHSEGENAPKMQSQTTVRQSTPSGRLIDSEARTSRNPARA